MLTIRQHCFAFVLLALVSIQALAQQKAVKESILYGRWNVVKHDYRGYQKFSIKQANQLNKSTLIIEKNRYYFTNIKFVNTCPVFKWNMHPYDTTMSLSMPMEMRYSKKDLAKKVLFLEAVNKKGEPCYNECLLFFKQDTLISIVGGYTYFRIKIK